MLLIMTSIAATAAVFIIGDVVLNVILATIGTITAIAIHIGGGVTTVIDTIAITSTKSGVIFSFAQSSVAQQ